MNIGNTIEIHFFGILRSFFAESVNLKVKLESCTTKEILEILSRSEQALSLGEARRYQLDEILKVCAVATDSEILGMDDKVTVDCKVNLFPPVSGG